MKVLPIREHTYRELWQNQKSKFTFPIAPHAEKILFKLNDGLNVFHNQTVSGGEYPL